MAISSPRNVTPVKVREPNGLGEPLIHQLLHGLPGVEVVAVHVGAVVALVSQREHRVLAVVRREAAVRAESANLSCKLNPRCRELFSDWSNVNISPCDWLLPVLGTAWGQWITKESM